MKITEKFGKDEDLGSEPHLLKNDKGDELTVTPASGDKFSLSHVSHNGKKWFSDGHSRSQALFTIDKFYNKGLDEEMKDKTTLDMINDKNHVEIIPEINSRLYKAIDEVLADMTADVADKSFRKVDENANPYISQKWPAKLHRKIDIYHNGTYKASTNAYENLKKAKMGYSHSTKLPVDELKTMYAESVNEEIKPYSSQDFSNGALLRHEIDDDNRFHMHKEHGVYQIVGFKNGKHFRDTARTHTEAMKKFNAHKNSMKGLKEETWSVLSFDHSGKPKTLKKVLDGKPEKMRFDNERDARDEFERRKKHTYGSFSTHSLTKINEEEKALTEARHFVYKHYPDLLQFYQVGKKGGYQHKEEADKKAAELNANKDKHEINHHYTVKTIGGVDRIGENSEDGTRGYIGFHNGKQVELRANSLYDAKKKAVAHFKPKKSQEHMVHVHLAQDENGEDVVHTPTF